MKQSTSTTQQLGLLKITIISGNLIRETSTITKMDPYVVVTYKDEEFRTKVHKDGGKKP